MAATNGRRRNAQVAAGPGERDQANTYVKEGAQHAPWRPATQALNVSFITIQSPPFPALGGKRQRRDWPQSFGPDKRSSTADGHGFKNKKLER